MNDPRKLAGGSRARLPSMNGAVNVGQRYFEVEADREKSEKKSKVSRFSDEAGQPLLRMDSIKI